MNETENFVPTRTEANLKDIVSKLPSAENIEISEISVEPDTVLIGTYDGVQMRTLKEPDTYTGRMTKEQLSMVLTKEENAQLEYNESENDLASVHRFVWASPGLLRELETNEVERGQKIKIKRRGAKKNTRWTIIPVN